MTALFTPPTVTEAAGGPDRFWSRIQMTHGISVLKTDGAYRQVRSPSQYDCEAADVVYLGGHVYEIDEDEQTALVEAGYGAYITDL